MKPLEKMFADGRPVLIGFLVLGHPDPETTLEAAVRMIDAGVDALEIGLPVADPVADGPVIRRACESAVARKLTFEDECLFLSRLRESVRVPIGVLTYAHRLQVTGPGRFVGSLIESGVDSLLVADAPHDADVELTRALHFSDLDRIGMVIPGMEPGRIRSVGRHSSGYLYGVHFKGVTGSRQHTRTGLVGEIAAWRNGHELPVVVGFGISTPEQVSSILRSGADGVVVGSAGVARLDEAGGVEALADFYGSLARARDAVVSVSC